MRDGGRTRSRRPTDQRRGPSRVRRARRAAGVPPAARRASRSTVACACCASSSSSPSSSSAARPSRSPRPQDDLARMARSQQVREVTIPAPRGAILDRDGEPIAVGQERRTVYATPYMLTDLDTARGRRRPLARRSGLKKRARRALERALSDPESGFAYVARKVEIDARRTGAGARHPRRRRLRRGEARLPDEDGRRPARRLRRRRQRRPRRSREGATTTNSAAAAGEQVVVRDPGGRTLKTISSVEPVVGQNVRLTIDRGIQFTAERVLADTVRRYSAKGGTAIVMDPATGEILAMANAPLVDANRFGESPAAAQRNRAVTDCYEPGSTFKVITVAGALSEKLVTPSTTFTLPGQLQVYDRVIHESHSRGTQRFTVRRILAESSNIGAVWLGWKVLGKQRMMKWIKAFGFGTADRHRLPRRDRRPRAAARPVVGRRRSATSPWDRGSPSRPCRWRSAYATIANDGVMVKPHVAMQVGDHDQPRRRAASRPERQGRAPAARHDEGRRRRRHRYRGADPRLSGRRQDGDGTEAAAERRRLLEDRLRRLVRRHGAGRRTPSSSCW